MTSATTLIPTAMAQAIRWINWIPVADRKDPKKINKVPIDPFTHKPFEKDSEWQTDPTRWTSLDRMNGQRKGFTLGDGWTGIDLDGCVVGGNVAPWAIEIVRALGTYAEVSPSGTGIKIFMHGTRPDGAENVKKCDAWEWEIYSGKRYFTVTGNKLPEAPNVILDRTEVLRRITDTLWGDDLIGLCKLRNLFLHDAGQNVHIHCPWEAEHTHGAGEKDAALQVKDGEIVGFHCFHGHCAKRSLRDVRKWFGIAGDLAHPLTEAGDAECFADLYADLVCFDARRGRWLLAEDESGLWLPDPVERLRGYAVEAMRARQRQANAINDLEKRKQAWNWALKGESTTRLNNLLREARTQPGIRNDSFVEPWDADLFLLGVPGGVVDLRSGQKRRARPEERVTMRAGAEYDPSARSVLWENALREISDDDEAWVNYLQRLGGYTATGDVSQDKWFIKHGKHGREGKGTIDGAWTGALGDYVLELPSAVFELRPKGNPDFDLSYLPNRRFVSSGESGNTIHLNHDRIKKLTGGGGMRVANKHEKSFEFVPTCKLWLACNDLPTVTDDSAAFWARVIVIPFRRSFHGREDTTLRPLLTNDPAHRRAVLAWLVKGAIDYCREGLGEMPRSIKEATVAFRDIAWPLTPLVTEDCVVAPDARVSVGDFNLAYQRFCERQGVPKEKRLGWKRVLKLMEGRYETVNVDEMTQGDVRVREKRYLGIGLREPVESPEPVTFPAM